MKRMTLLLLLFLSLSTFAQSRLDDIGRITIHAYVPEYEDLPYESSKLLQSKLSQIITANGIADNENCVRFVLTAKVNVISKDIIPGPPHRISQKLDITLILGDIESDKVYSQYTITAVGVGTNYEKSFISAFKNIKPANKEISTFIDDGKQKILAYYQTNCEDLLLEAQRLATQNHYEDALILISSIPDVCSECYEQAVTIASKIYNEMINVRGAECLRQAQAAWANNPTRQGAAEATALLSQINFAASCQSEVPALLSQITAKMNEIDRREWEHEMQQYHDSVEREKRNWEQQVREYEDRVQTQRMYIKACRDVAITRAQNQPKVITRVVNYNRVIFW